MAILLCAKCGYLREVRSQYTGKSVICPECRHASPVQDTIQLLKNVIRRYRQQSRELKQARERTASLERLAGPEPPASAEADSEASVDMKILNSFREQEIPVACLRGFHVNFPNGDKHELDGFFLVGNGIPLCIECKSGEFRQDIKKFSQVRKKLNLDRTGYLVCAIGLSDAQINGFNSMYDVTFANEANFLQHVRRLVQ